MKIEIARVYSGDQFKKKLKAMSEKQIFAIYHRLKTEGNIK